MVLKMAFKYDSKRFLTEKEAANLVDLVHETLGLNLRGFINDQNARDLVRFMPVKSVCKNPGKKWGLQLNKPQKK